MSRDLARDAAADVGGLVLEVKKNTNRLNLLLVLVTVQMGLLVQVAFRL